MKKLCELPEWQRAEKKKRIDETVARRDTTGIERLNRDGSKKSFGQLHDAWVQAGRPLKVDIDE